MSLKKSLKEAKQYIEANDPESALESIEDALEYDSDNYFAYIFQGKLYQLLHDLTGASKSFQRATELEPDNLLGWKGYFQIAKSGEDFDLFFKILATYLRKQLDLEQPIADLIKDAKNYLSYHDYKKNNELYEKYLRSLLPGSELGEINLQLNSVFLPISTVLQELVELVGKNERDHMNTVISKEKLRLPRNLLPQHKAVLNNVKWNIYRQSDMPELLGQLVNVLDDDESRKKYSNQLLEYKYDLLNCCPPTKNLQLQKEIRELVEGLIIIKQASLLCWTIYFDWMDIKNLSSEELDLGNVILFLQTFPNLGLAMVLYAYIMSDISPFNTERVKLLLDDDNKKKNNKGGSDTKGVEEEGEEALLSLEDDAGATTVDAVSPKEILSILTEGFQSCSGSIFASRIVCNYYIHLHEYEEGSIKCRDAIRLLADLQRSTGVDLVNTREDILCSLAIIYTYYEAPKNFGKALQLYDRILSDNSTNVKAKIGKGLILIEKNQLTEAKGLLQEVVQQHPNNSQAIVELNWCLIKLGEISIGRKGLQGALSLIKGTDVHSAETRAIIYWRISRSFNKEKNFEEEFNSLILSLKESKNFAPSYTSLGVLYEDQYNDKGRAQKCFYKAFELDVGEIVSARYLVADLTKNNEWEIAEVLSKRIVTTERSRRMLFDEEKGGEGEQDRSWPYRVLGCAALNRQEDDKAVEWFQTALRMKSMDVQCWIGLGEAYHNCGRFDAAAKVLKHTLTLANDDPLSTWVVQYMLGVVLSEMGSFESAENHLTTAIELKPGEECVVHALYECMINNATNLVLGGFISRAVDMNTRTVDLILEGANINKTSQMLWKDLGDCIRIFNIIKEREVPSDKLIKIIKSVEIDHSNIFMEELREIDQINDDHIEVVGSLLVSTLGILSAKAAIYVLPAKSNKLMRSMCYYNLGLAYLEGYKNCEDKTTFRDCSIKALKKAIQLEGSNATYWVTLGNAFASTNPQISQHCFIKATALESRDADIWTNLAALYLRYGDHQLAEEAFLRALSVAPQQPQSWLGHALLAQSSGKKEDAFKLFNHAYILANGKSSLAQLLYGLSIITKRLHSGVDQRDIQASQEYSVANFAMNNYLKYSPKDEVGLSIAMIISERCKDYAKGIEIGNTLISILKEKYETDESEVTLLAFARAMTLVARMYLGVGEFDKALDSASFGLTVVGADDEESEVVEEYTSLVLSARITVGLCFFFNDQFDDALDQLRIILAQKSDSQRLVTLIAQILYSYNTEETKQAAIDQLFNFIEENGSSLLVVLTLGAISVVDNLDDYLGAIKEELQGLSLSELIGDSIRIVPQLISEINKRISNGGSDDYTWQRNAVLFPQDYHVWSKLNSEMAVKVAELNDTKLNAGDTSMAYFETGKLRSIQRSLLINPENALAIKGLEMCIE